MEEAQSILSATGGHSEDAAICKPGEEASPELDHAGTLISEFQLPELGAIHFCGLSHPVYGNLLCLPEVRLGIAVAPLGKRIIGSRCH